MKRNLLYSILIVTTLVPSLSCMAQDPKIHAYSRAKTSGIPGDHSLPTDYFLYLEVPKGMRPSLSTIWLKGKYYSATLLKVNTPVLIDNDVASIKKHKDTLVRKTAGDVYRIELGQEVTTGNFTAGSTEGLDVVANVKINNKQYKESIKNIITLKPLQGM